MSYLIHIGHMLDKNAFADSLSLNKSSLIGAFN
jgi:hypothetical protein